MVLLNVLTFAENFVWKDANSFRKIQKNLQELMKTNGSNEILSELWEEASQIAQMNDRCSSISLTEVLDEECGYFYKVELPKFEKEFQRVSGEIRMNAMNIQYDVNDKLKMLKACAEALDVFFIAESQLKTFDGEPVTTRPMDLSGETYELTYSFETENDENTLRSLHDMAETWTKQCSEVVLENRELFYELADKLNKEVSLHKGLSASLQVGINSYTCKLSFYFKHNAGGYYEFGNAKICSTRDKETNPYLEIDLEERNGNGIKTYSQQQVCRGTVILETKNNLWGRWVWNPDVVNCSSIFYRGSKDYWNCIAQKSEK